MKRSLTFCTFRAIVKQFFQQKQLVFSSLSEKPRRISVDSSSIVVTPQAQDFAKDISVKPASEAQNAPNITQKGPDPQPISQATV